MDLTILVSVVGAYLMIHMFVTLVRAYLRNIKLSSIFTTESIGLIEFGRGIIRRAFKPGTFILAVIITLVILFIHQLLGI